MAAGSILGPALSGGTGGQSASSGASTGDVLFGDTSFGSGPVVNVGGGEGFSLSPQMLMIGGGLLIAGLVLMRRK